MPRASSVFAHCAMRSTVTGNVLAVPSAMPRLRAVASSCVNAASMSAAVYQLYLKQLLQLGWREWLTGRLSEAWMREARHYQLEAGAAEADNPDQRIAEDVRVATELAIEFSIGLLISFSMLVAFVGILWSLSGPLAFTLAGRAVEVPGYMVWAAVLYATLGSAATWLLGRPMVGINVRRTTAEADFRFGLT